MQIDHEQSREYSDQQNKNTSKQAQAEAGIKCSAGAEGRVSSYLPGCVICSARPHTSIQAAVTSRSAAARGGGAGQQPLNKQFSPSQGCYCCVCV